MKTMNDHFLEKHFELLITCNLFSGKHKAPNILVKGHFIVNRTTTHTATMSKISFIEVNHGEPPSKARQVFLDEKPGLEIKKDNQNNEGSKYDFYDQVDIV